MKAKLAVFAALVAFVSPLVHVNVQAADRPPLLATGTDAPDFTAVRGDNSKMKLSELRGNFVLVDFWSTWCPPCKASMPHIDKIHQKLKDQGLVVLGVCVWDDRANFNKWLVKPEVNTSYQKVFDPAGRGARDIAKSLYKVSGIPTFYLIDKDGKVVYSGVGAGTQTERGLDNALRGAGFKL